jgi:hypothetical protein
MAFDQVGFAQILNTLVGGQLTEAGGSMLLDTYNINSDISQYSPEDWGRLTDRSNQAQWLIDNFELIKERFEAVIKGQVKFRELQAWLEEKGFKGASKIKEAEVKSLAAGNDYLESVAQQDYKLGKEKERGTAQTEDFKRGEDSRIINAIQAYKDSIDAQIASAEGNPDYQAAMAEYNANKPNTLIWATEMLKGGSYAANHPKLKGNQQVLGVGSSSSNSSSGWTWGGQSQQRAAADSLKFEMNGNFARSVNNLAGNFGRGLKRIGRFFGGGK